MQKQIEAFGRNFFYVREFKKQYENYWTNTNKKYYFTVEDTEHEFKYKSTSKSLAFYLILGFILLGVVLLILWMSWKKLRNKENEEKSVEAKAEKQPIREKLLEEKTVKTKSNLNSIFHLFKKRTKHDFG